MRNPQDRAKQRERILKKARSFKKAGTTISITAFRKLVGSDPKTIKAALKEEKLLSVLKEPGEFDL